MAGGADQTRRVHYLSTRAPSPALESATRETSSLHSRRQRLESRSKTDSVCVGDGVASAAASATWRGHSWACSLSPSPRRVRPPPWLLRCAVGSASLRAVVAAVPMREGGGCAAVLEGCGAVATLPPKLGSPGRKLGEAPHTHLASPAAAARDALPRRDDAARQKRGASSAAASVRRCPAAAVPTTAPPPLHSPPPPLLRLLRSALAASAWQADWPLRY